MIHDNQRYVLALRFVEKGFCCVPVLKTFRRRKIRFIIPIPVRGKSGGVRTLFESASRKTAYPFKSPKQGQWEVATVVVKYSKGRYKRKDARWFAYVVNRLSKSIAPHQVFEMYRLLKPQSGGVLDP